MKRAAPVLFCSLLLTASATTQETLVRVELTYRAPGTGPSPNFSPKGTQVTLTALPDSAPLPAGAIRPAKTGVIKVGPDAKSWIPVLATASPAHELDLCQLFLDRNRNGRFDDEGAALTATPTENEKTKAWWSSIGKVELNVPYGAGGSEPYLVNFWMVREGDKAPDILRYSVGSWRAGTATVAGVPALVAVMDGNNDALFAKDDTWSVLESSAPNADKAVLSIAEARAGNRFMFVKDANREHVLEFRSITPDGRSLTFAVVDKLMTKAADRLPDDMVGPERGRPRTTTPFVWSHSLPEALAKAKTSGKKVIVDFETTWCGPCKTMDEWIWTDADVAKVLADGYIGVKLDGDIEKAIVKQYTVAGYPTMIVLTPAGIVSTRALGYQSSAQMLTLLGGK